MANRTRGKVFCVPVTTEEEQQILLNVKKSKMNSISAYFRKMALDGMIVKIDLSEVKENTVAINRIGNNINQIAKRMNSTNDFSSNSVEQIINMMGEVMQMQRKILLSFNKVIK